MAKIDVLDILRSKKSDPMSFHFDRLWIPPMQFYLSPQDVEELRKIATSVRLSSKINQKYKMIDNIMVARGFKRFSAGTNRVVYRCLEDTRFLVKIAVDKVGMQDNPLEYKNQFLLQPFVTKMFYVSPCGTIGFSERVLPVKNKEEFKQIAPDVFDIIVNKILGIYVVEDVGTKYFMNWGIRPGFGPVLLDYPYVYNLDGDKLFCNWKNPMTGEVCDSEIDYDAGFNHLVCTRCGKTYLATDLRDDSIDNKIIIKKGGFQMRVLLKRGNQIIGEPIPTDEVMVRPASKPKKNTGIVVGIKRPSSDTEILNRNTTIVNMANNGNVSASVSVGDNLSSVTTKMDVPTTPTIQRTWSPDLDDDDDNNETTEFKTDVDNDETTSNSTIISHETEDDSESSNKEDVINDNENEDNHQSFSTNTEEDDDYADPVFASDVDLVRERNRRPRNEKGQFMPSEEGLKRGKNKKKKGGTKSSFIPSQL